MKKIIALFLCITVSFSVTAQEKLAQYMKEANEMIEKKDYKSAQSSLQKALTEVNTMIGSELLSALPTEINQMKADVENDTNGGVMPGLVNTGVTVTRDYFNEEKSATVTIMSNSPASVSINMLISNPSLFGSVDKDKDEDSDEIQKVVPVGKFFGMLSYDTEDKSGNIQIPVGSSVITVTADGIESADDVTLIALKLDIDNLKKILGE